MYLFFFLERKQAALDTLNLRDTVDVSLEKLGGGAMPSLKLACNRILQEFCGAVVAFADRMSRPYQRVNAQGAVFTLKQPYVCV